MENAIKVRLTNALGWLTAYLSQEGENHPINLLVYLRSKDQESRDQNQERAESRNSEKVYELLKAVLKEHEAIAANSAVEDSINLTLTFVFFPELERCLQSNGFRIKPI